MQKVTEVPTAIYVRMSKDRTGAGLGIARQERECRELVDATLESHNIVEVFTDNDVSASTGKPRPGYLAMLDAIRDGRIRAVVSWHTDRLHRSPLELEEYIGLGVPTFTVKAGPLDLSTPAGRMAARTFGAVARYEVEQKSERQKAANRQTARAGLMQSGPVPWGYADDRLTLDPVTAPVFQDVHRRILAGETLGSVIRWLNDQGITTPRGGRWSYSALRNVLTRPLNAGLVLHDGAILTDVQSRWQPLVTVEQHHAMLALLSDPARRTTSGNRRRHLLAGIARCGNCGKGLRSGWVGQRDGRQVNLYRCGNAECPARVNVSRDQLDVYVTDRLLNERGGAWVARVKASENTGALLADVEARIAGVTSQLAQDGADVESLVSRLGELKSERAALSKPQRVGWRLSEVHGEWRRAQDVDERRAILLEHLDTLSIASRGKTSHRFDPERVTLTWREDPYDEAEDQADNAERWAS